YHLYFFFSSRRRHTRSKRDWSSDVCSSDLQIYEKFNSLYFSRNLLKLSTSKALFKCNANKHLSLLIVLISSLISTSYSIKSLIKWLIKEILASPSTTKIGNA